MRKFYSIMTPPFDPTSGGIRVMWGLYGWLLAKGQVAYTNATSDNPDDFIAIYPEIYRGNEAGAKTVVRYLLNKPGTMALYGTPGLTTFDKNDKIRNSKMIYMIVEQVGNKYKVQNIVTKEILKKLYSPRNLLKVDSVDELNEVVETINEPEKKYIGNTIVKSRKNRTKKEEPIKYIGATPIKSRQRKKI